jgi:GNAT superfamily N-acetyltransferase
VIEVHSAATDPALYLGISGAEIPAEQLARQKPDELLLAQESGRPVARCGLWWTNVAAYPNHKLGVIGHYWADYGAAGEAVLGAACSRLATEGCTRAVGPMDGNTWQRYRFITERGSEPPFFLEPDNPDDWPSHWTAAGFSTLATYHSALATDLATRAPRVKETAPRLDERGITLRNLDLAHFEAELERLHTLSLICFVNNFLYTPISYAEFAAQYAPVQNYLRPELAFLAEKGGELVGFIIAAPDLLQAKRGAPIDTVVAKTMAVHPDFAGAGLGGYLMDQLHAGARALGFGRVIHALFHADNRSGKISRHTAQLIRTYTLFSRDLGGRA